MNIEAFSQIHSLNISLSAQVDEFNMAENNNDAFRARLSDLFNVSLTAPPLTLLMKAYREHEPGNGVYSGKNFIATVVGNVVTFTFKREPFPTMFGPNDEAIIESIVEATTLCAKFKAYRVRGDMVTTATQSKSLTRQELEKVFMGAVSVQVFDGFPKMADLPCLP